MAVDARNVGTMLLEDGLLSESQLEYAIASQEESGLPLGRVLVEEGLVSETDLMRTLASRLGIEFIDLADVSVDPSAAALVPEYLRTRYGVSPIGFEEDRLVVAMSDPGNVLAIDDVRAVSGLDIVLVVATRSDIDFPWDAHFPQAAF